MTRVTYRWQREAGIADQFAAWWHERTLTIRGSQPGAMGSTLLRSPDGTTFVGVARWASEGDLAAFREAMGSVSFPGANLVSIEVLEEVDDLTVGLAD